MWAALTYATRLPCGPQEVAVKDEAASGSAAPFNTYSTLLALLNLLGAGYTLVKLNHLVKGVALA